jgi:hypothetical protein
MPRPKKSECGLWRHEKYLVRKKIGPSPWGLQDSTVCLTGRTGCKKHIHSHKVVDLRMFQGVKTSKNCTGKNWNIQEKLTPPVVTVEGFLTVFMISDFGIFSLL